MVNAVGRPIDMTFNNPFKYHIPLLSLYQQSHDLKKEAYSHGSDADVRVRGPSVILRNGHCNVVCCSDVLLPL